jgi:hypothetical protein
VLPDEYLARAAAEMTVVDALPAFLRHFVHEHGFQAAGGYTILKKAAAEERRRQRKQRGAKDPVA